VLTPAEVTALIGGCSHRSPTGIRNRALLLTRITDLLGVSPTAIRIIPALAGGG